MLALAIALLALAVAFAALLVVEVWRFKAGRHLISPRRLALRLVAGSLLIALLVGVFLGLFVLHLKEPGNRPELFLAFWSACFVIAVALIFVMLADLREVGARYLERQHQIWHDFASYLAKQQAKPAEDVPKKDDPKE